jgi:hypothetical protein
MEIELQKAAQLRSFVSCAVKKGLGKTLIHPEFNYCFNAEQKSSEEITQEEVLQKIWREKCFKVLFALKFQRSRRCVRANDFALAMDRNRKLNHK